MKKLIAWLWKLGIGYLQDNPDALPNMLIDIEKKLAKHPNAKTSAMGFVAGVGAELAIALSDDGKISPVERDRIVKKLKSGVSG